MNVVKGLITRIVNNDCFTSSTVKVRGKSDFTVITLELKESFRESSPVALLFKETDVILVKGRYSRLSVENRFACRITGIKAGDVFVELELETSFGPVRAVVGRAAYAHLAAGRGADLYAYIKANEISLTMEP